MLRGEAGLTQKVLATKAGISERWLRAWECGQRAPSDDARSWVAQVLAEHLRRPAEDIEREIGSQSEIQVERARVEALSVGEAEAPDAVRDLLARALDGFRTGSHLHRFPAFLQHDAEGSLFLLVRHNDRPSLSELRSDHVLVYVPWEHAEGIVSFEAAGERGAGHELSGLGPLPFVGIARDLTLPIGEEVLASGGAGGPARDRGAPLRVRALVTPVCRERTQPSVPRLLSEVLPRKARGGPVTERDFENWLDLAQSLATALWSLHASGWAHLAVSPENVMLRVDHGLWRDVTLFNVWDRGRLPSGEPASAAKRTDLFDLGITLLSALVGEPVDVDPEEVRPPLFAARRRFRGRLEGEMNRRALNLCLRYLLEPAPPTPPGETEVTIDANDDSHDLGFTEASTEVLMKLVNEVGALRALHRRRGLARPPVRLGTGSSADGVRGPLTEPSAGALSGSPASSASRPERPDALSTMLATLSRQTEAGDRKRWCDRYVGRATHVELAGREAEPSIDVAAELFEAGYGRAAGARLSQLVDLRGKALPANDAVRLLRMLVGVLLAREGALEEGREALSRFWGSNDARVGWWAMLLEQRIAAESGIPPARDIPPPAPSGDREEDARAFIWDLSYRFFVELRRGKALTPAQIEDIARLLHGESAHEAIYGALLLARASAREPVREGLLRGIRAVLFAASYAATREMPHEYASALALGAWLIRAAAREPSLRAELSARGTEIDECLVVAAECDLQAAEMYQWLDVPIRSCQAFQAAADCLFLCDAPEWVMHGFRWLALARNQRMLPWSPPDLLDRQLCERRFLGPRFTSTGRIFERGEDEALLRGVEIWWDKSQAPESPAGRRDPGCVAADDYYDLYGPGIEWAFGTGGVTVELLSASEDGSRRPDARATLDALFELSERTLGVPAAPGQRVLELGCGGCLTASELVARGFEVVAVDSSAWAVQRAHERAAARGGAGGAKFLCRDATLLDASAEGLAGQFDWVVLRDSLAHFIQKRRVLARVFSCLRPGGVLIGTDWIQRRTSSRWAWWRMSETVWSSALESELGIQRLLMQSRMANVYMERHDEDMHAFFEHRLAWVSSATRRPAGSTDEMAVRLRAQSDLGAMRDLASPEGPLGWLFFTAQRPS
ncbi:MAG: methyltransferase domain-containing protein [Polyangiaceae bacterium]